MRTMRMTTEPSTICKDGTAEGVADVGPFFFLVKAALVVTTVAVMELC